MNRNIPLITFLITVFISPADTLRSAFEGHSPSPRGVGVSEAMTAVSGGIDSLTYNPGALGKVERGALSTFQTHLFGLSELSNESLIFILPTQRKGVWSGRYGQMGPSRYREKTFSLAQSLRMSSLWSLGWGLSHHHLKIRRYGSSSSLSVHGGIHGAWNSGIQVGLSLRHVNQPRLRNTGEGLRRVLSVGTAFKQRGGILLALDGQKVQEDDFSLRAGVEIPVMGFLVLRSGVQSRSERFSLGTGFLWGDLRIDYAFRSHGFLADEHHFGFQWDWGPTKRRFRARKEPLPLLGPVDARVNINGALQKDLETLPGIGPVTARRILLYRKTHGPFQKDLDLLKVPLSRRVFLNIRPLIKIQMTQPVRSK